MSLDSTIQTMFPLLTAPREDVHRAPLHNGTRYIAAQDGLWREVSLPWIFALHRIAHSEFPLPYGTLSEQVSVKCGPIPQELRTRFIQDAKRALPNEMAAALIWNSVDASWRYALRRPLSASSSYVAYNEVELADGEFLVCDLHSHAQFDAFFSAQDDRDDQGSMKFSGVIGKVGSEQLNSTMRLNLLGKSWDGNLAANGQLEVLCH
jgi:PRTRC genetic system protein A